MGYAFNPFTGNFDVTGTAASIPDPLTVNNLTVNTLLTAAHIHGNVAGSLYIHVKNTSNTTLAKGTPVYAVGAVGDTTTLEVAAADSANAAKSPAIGILDQELIHNASGHAVMFGEITGVNTGGYAIGDELYLASGGGLTSTRPTSGYVQSLAVVGRVHASTGTILVWAASEIPPTDLAYDAATRQLSSSTGTDVTLPLATIGAPGLMPALSFAAITYAADIVLDMAALDGQVRTISLAGNLSPTTINRATGRSVSLRIIADSTQRTFTFPAGWTFGGTKPANIAASKTGVLSLTFFGSADTDCFACWVVQG